jgi:hypothetical protein
VNPLEGIEEGPAGGELRQEALTIPLQEARPERGRETALVVSEEGAAYPLHDRVPRLQLVGVHLEPYVLVPKTELVQERRVGLRGEDR